MRLAGFVIFCLAACAAADACAQAARDPVAVLLSPGAQPATPEDEQAERPAAAPAEAEPEAALPAIPAGPAHPSAGAIGVDETGRSPEGPPSPRVQAYDTRIRASFAAAESFQGPLDGGWTVSAGGRGDLYGLQIVDRRGRLEGAWRDLGRTGPGSVGLIDHMARTGESVTLSFSPAGQTPVTLTLAGVGRTMSGALDEAGRRTPVMLRRTGP